MTKTGPVVAVVDDEAPMRKALGRLLKSHGFRVESFGRGDEFLAASALHPTDCVLLDLHMGGVTGFDVLASLAEQPEAPPVIVITGHDEPDTCKRVRELGASAYLLKPVDAEELFGALHKAIEQSDASHGRPKA